MDAILDDNKLRLLRTKKIYDQLDKAKDICQENRFYNLAKQILNHYNGLKDVSDKILKGLCYAYGNNFQDESVIDICSFLYYWLGDILYDKLNPRINFGSAITNLFAVLKNVNGKNCTPPTNYNIYHEKYFKNIKLFFDYSKDYDTYDKQITNNNLSCNENYNEYLQKYVKAYKEAQSECQNKATSGYCNEFNEYFQNKDSKNLSNWTCKLQNKEPKAERTNGQTKYIKEQEFPAHRGKEKSVAIPGGLEGGREQVEEVHSNPGYHTEPDTSVLSSDSGHADVPSISGTTKTITTAVSAAGLLVPPFLVYNFTPVRSWINKLLGRNPIYRNPLTERELIENSYIPYHFDSERNSYNISYRPE